MGTIVVGVDGSDESRRALRWAFEEAALRGATLRVVYAYDYTSSSPPFPIPEATLTGAQIRNWQEELQRESARVREHAEEFVGELVAEAHQGGVKVETVVLHDRHPAHALVDQSEGADLLVVGSRGRGGFKGLILGSVSQHCLHHAACPVTVFRSDH